MLFPVLTLACSGGTGDSSDTADSETNEAGTDASASDSDNDSDNGSDSDSGTEPVSGIPILGDGTHDIDNLVVEVISSPGDGLNFPTDIEFKPGVAFEAWVTNRADNSITIYENAGRSGQVASKRQALLDNGAHFLAKPAALAFGVDGVMATAQQEKAQTQPGDPIDGSFMGPTMWTTDLEIFQGGHQSHLDMLHNSPLASGIAWEAGNTYWVYDGEHGSLTRYKFNDDHGLGGTDHTDGEIYRYADGQLGYEPFIASHVVVDPAGGYVYAADSANGRVVRLDPKPASQADAIAPNYDGCMMRHMSGDELLTLVDGSELDPPMTRPSGLELVDDILFVTDAVEGRVYGFDLDGNLLDWLETGYEPGSLMGMAFDDEGSMWITDPAENQLRRFSVPAE